MSISTVENKKRPAEILLVEDNYGDVLLTKKAFKSATIANNITVAEDGLQALAILNHQPPFEKSPTPDIILLDLNLPKKSGKELLQEIKSHDHLKHIPVVILTSSFAELDVVKSYHLHANGYIVKPVNLEKFATVVKSIEQFWFSVVVLPDDDEIKKV